MRWLWLVFGVSLAVRLLAWGFVEWTIAADPERVYFIAGDADGYWDLGTDIAAGRPYAVHEPPRRVMRTPGVPGLIAVAVAVFGESRTAARGVLAAVSAVAPVGVFLLGTVFLRPRYAAAAGLIAVVSPLAVGLSPTLLSDGPFSTALCLLCWRLAVLLREPTTKRAMMAGLLAAIASYIRPAILPAVPVLAVALTVADWHRGRSSGLVFAAVVAAALLPWAARNKAIAGVATPTTLWTGPTLYDSFRPDSDGGSDMRFFDDEASLREGMSETEVDKWYTRRAVQRIADAPGDALLLSVRKQLRFWSLRPRTLEAGPPAIGWACAAWSATVLGLAVVGGWRSRSHWLLLLTAAGPVVYFAALHLIFVGSMRYRMPAELPLCVLSLAAFASPLPAQSDSPSSESSSGSGGSRNVTDN